MATVKNQHFIPKTYLKKFSKNKKKEYYVEAIDINTNEKISTNIRNICAKSNLYTSSTITIDPHFVENFYAKEIDAIYPLVYDLLLNKEAIEISSGQKKKILNTIFSLYFRTPKYLNRQNRLTDKFIDHLIEHSPPDKDFINFYYEGKLSVFNRREGEKFKADIHEQNKETFLIVHMEQWAEFVEYMRHCRISVYEISDDIDLITSDNPVTIQNYSTDKFSLFSPNNVIQLPLDKKHLLFIYYDNQQKNSNRIYRGTRDFSFALTSNSEMNRSAEQWIIGYPGTVDKHIKDQIKYNEPTEENEELVEMAKQKYLLASDLLTVARTNGMFNKTFADKVNEYRKLDVFKNDPEIQRYAPRLTKLGLIND